MMFSLSAVPGRVFTTTSQRERNSWKEVRELVAKCAAGSWHCESPVPGSWNALADRADGLPDLVQARMVVPNVEQSRPTSRPMAPYLEQDCQQAEPGAGGAADSPQDTDGRAAHLPDVVPSTHLSSRYPRLLLVSADDQCWQAVPTESTSATYAAERARKSAPQHHYAHHDVLADRADLKASGVAEYEGVARGNRLPIRSRGD